MNDFKKMTQLKAMLKIHEGEKFSLYRCTAGKLTIGVGHNLEAKGVSKRVSEIMLEEDINENFAALSKYKWFTRLNPDRQAAIVDMSFMGVAKLLEFKKMISCLKVEDYVGASHEMLDSLWAEQVGQRAKTLSRIIETGKLE